MPGDEDWGLLFGVLVDVLGGLTDNECEEPSEALVDVGVMNGEG